MSFLCTLISVLKHPPCSACILIVKPRHVDSFVFFSYISELHVCLMSGNKQTFLRTARFATSAKIVVFLVLRSRYFFLDDQFLFNKAFTTWRVFVNIIHKTL
uniref:Putative secreted protein ovary overexpressed n=1 Tax=Rhipicephalus microplus TaxID=6941 RepID=A0A6M2DD10_RHIMP